MNSIKSALIGLGGFAMLAMTIGMASAQVVALGASNTEGKGVGESAAYPAQLQAMLRTKGVNMRVSNAGISGDTTEGMLGRLSSAVPQGTRVVIVQYGGNDRRRGLSRAQHQANIAQIESRLRSRHIKVVHADNYVWQAIRAGMTQFDRIHLTVEGHRQVAAKLLSSIR
jgi:acyl-CoA thioesterase-1